MLEKSSSASCGIFPDIIQLYQFLFFIKIAKFLDEYINTLNTSYYFENIETGLGCIQETSVHCTEQHHSSLLLHFSSFGQTQLICCFSYLPVHLLLKMPGKFWKRKNNFKQMDIFLQFFDFFPFYFSFYPSLQWVWERSKKQQIN